MNLNVKARWDARPARHPCRTPHRHGVVLIIVAVMMIVFIGFLGLAVDWLYTVRTAQQLQAAADAAALQGALHLPQGVDAVIDEAVNLALKNYAAGEQVVLVPGDDGLSGDVQVGRYHRVSSNNPTAWFEPTVDSPNAVRVIANRTEANPKQELALFFGGIFGVPDVPITRDAVAMRGPGAGLVVLDPDGPCSFDIGGTGDLNVENGAIYVNSDYPQQKNQGAACNAGTVASVTSEAFFVNGEPARTFDQVDASPEPQKGGPIPDPLAYLADGPDPANGPFNYSTTELQHFKGGNPELSSGYYGGGIKVSGGAQLKLKPGVYVIGGNGLSVENGSLDARGVLIYLARPSAGLFLSGGVITITPMRTGDYAGVSIWQAYDNTAESTIIGNDTTNIEGAIYFPDTNKLTISGTGGSIANQVITNRIYFRGTGTLKINYDGSNNNMSNVFLVE